MDLLPSDPESRGHLPGAIQALYPLAPLSWFAPLWAYACGFLASSVATGTRGPGITGPAGRAASRFAGGGGSLLPFMLGLLLAGPLLAVVWGASAQLQRRSELDTDPPSDAPQKLVGAMPYALPGSASHRLASWLGAALASLQHAAPERGMALLRLLSGTVFSLAVAAELGYRTLAITAIALVLILARSLSHRPGVAPGTLSEIMDIGAPIVVTWLIGHATQDTLRAGSVLTAVCFALVLWGCSTLHRTGRGLQRLFLPQAVLVAYFIAARQPVTAAGVTLLASAQLLWSPLLQTPVGRVRYLRALQLPLAASMLLSAWTLGYGS